MAVLAETELARLCGAADALAADGTEGCLVVIGCASEETRTLAEGVLVEAIAERREWRPIALDRWVPEPMSHVAAWSAGVRRVSVFSVTGWKALAAAGEETLVEGLKNLDEAHDVIGTLRLVHWIDASTHDLFRRHAPIAWAASRVHLWIETDADRASGAASLADAFDGEETPGPPTAVAALLEIVELARSGPAEDLAAALLAAASAWRNAGSPGNAKRLYEEAMPFLANAGDQRGRAACLRGIAEALVAAGDDPSAAQYLDESRNAFTAFGDLEAAQECTPILAAVWARLGDAALARALYEEAAAAFDLGGAPERADACRREAERLSTPPGA